jgi:uncharacterized membrane protein
VRSRLGRTDAVSLALIGGTVAITLAAYGRLPAEIPVHFDIQGAPNGWMPRYLGAWVLPLSSLATWLLLRCGARTLPSEWRRRMLDSPTGIVSALVVGLLSALQWAILYTALESRRSIGSALPLLLGGFWVALGLVLPRIRRNPWIGVRTPWTLSSDENWAKTHRFAGLTFCIGGALALFFAISGPARLGIIAIVASAAVAAVYSFVLACRPSRG